MTEKRQEQRQRRPDAFLRDTKGATAIEYGIILMMIGLALLGMMSLTDVTNRISNTFYTVANTMSG
ncbi:MAG: Flp/Fap pilin component [Proteobacteria bacterium]|nr:Flp/Fap pilin component [Pseudomonadota bacterium]